MEGTILVPLDGSRLAEQALPYALGLARYTGGPVRLLEAVPDATRIRPAAAALEAKARALREEGVPVDTTVAAGDPPQVIAAAAAAACRGAGLIVMTTLGRSGLGRWLYGSVADGVLRRAPAPVLLVPATCEHPWTGGRPRAILVPLDGSAYAEEALAPAQALARACGAELRLVRVVALPLHPYGEGYACVGYDPTEDVAEARRYLEERAAALRAQGARVETISEVGDVAPLIAEHAHGADLVVMATHGRTGLARAVLGSVATGTVQRANRPVLLVRPEVIAAHTPLAPEAVGVATLPPGPAVPVSLTVDEIDLVCRGLSRLLGEVHPAEPVAALCARLRMASAEATRGAAAESAPAREP